MAAVFNLNKKYILLIKAKTVEGIQIAKAELRLSSGAGIQRSLRNTSLEDQSVKAYEKHIRGIVTMFVLKVLSYFF